MLLRNFYNMMALLLTGNTALNDGFQDGSLNLKNMSGDAYTALDSIWSVSSGAVYYWFPTCYLNYGKECFIFGTDDTAVTYDDYTLSLASLTNVQYSWDGINYDAESKTYSNTARFIFKNNTSSDITVKEIGIRTYGYQPQSVLLYREVLETPITIPAGNSVTYTHEFKFTMPQYR